MADQQKQLETTSSGPHPAPCRSPNQANPASQQNPQQLRAHQRQQIQRQSSLMTTTSSNGTGLALSTSNSSSSALANQGRQVEPRSSTGELSCATISAATNPADAHNPYPHYAPVTLFYLSQTARPRSWCLAIVSNKYPLHSPNEELSRARATR